MGEIFAGTGFNQVVHFSANDRKNNKTVYGHIGRSPVRSICVDEEHQRVIYSNGKAIFTAQAEGDVQEILGLREGGSILDVEYFHPEAIRYCLSDGSIFAKDCNAKNSPDYQPNQESILQFMGQKHSKFTKVVANFNRERYLFCGAGVVPIICNLVTGTQDWYGKNVKNDELDLEVPMKDIDASFIRDDKFIAILTADRKLRIYDVRGTHRRPVQDIALPVTPKSLMTRMKISPNQNQYYFSNDIGEIYKCDSRKDWKIISKYKGITSTVTDIQISEPQNALVASSLDSYVRIFELDTCKLSRKVYVNKPVYSLTVVWNAKEKVEESLEEGAEEEINLQEEEEEDQPKRVERLKQIRKRNKVGLKYLQPREFDQPQIKQQEQAQKKEWYEGLNPIDRRDFQE